MSINQRARSAESISEKISSLSARGSRQLSLSPRAKSSLSSSPRTRLSIGSSPRHLTGNSINRPENPISSSAAYLQTIEQSAREFRAELMCEEAARLRESVLNAQIQMIIGIAKFARTHQAKITIDHHFRMVPAYCMICNFTGVYELRIDGISNDMFICIQCADILKHAHG